MSNPEYTIVKGSGSDPSHGIENIKDIDRTIHFQTRDDSILIEIEFRATKLESINLGIMSSLKVTIKGWHKGMNNKKQLISKSESVEHQIKALVYRSNQFENVIPI